jgi:putative flippase GtrA
MGTVEAALIGLAAGAVASTIVGVLTLTLPIEISLWVSRALSFAVAVVLCFVAHAILAG